MNVRPMTIEDYPHVHALWQASEGIGLNDVNDSEVGIRTYLERNPSTSFVAEDDHRIVGAILAGHDGRRGFLYHAAVHPDFRCRGIGTSLVDTALAALQTEGIIKVALVALANNDEGNAFWEARAFTHREDLTYRNRFII